MAMAGPSGVPKDKPPKFDPNTEAFQLRAQEHKAEMCRKQWHEHWSWLLDERKKASEESQAIRRETAEVVSQLKHKEEIARNLKPLPETTAQCIGWLASRPDCKLEDPLTDQWIPKIPFKALDAWELPGYKPAPKYK